MIERLTTRRFALPLAVISGALALSGCGNTVEGIGNVPMVHCGDGQQPRHNSVRITEAPKDEEIQLGKEITTDTNGDNATGDFLVRSLGGGEFTLVINKDADNTVELVPDYSPNSVAVSDEGELFRITGHQGPNGSTGFDISVSCEKQ